MIEKGTPLFYIDEGIVHRSRAAAVETGETGFTFTIEGYGACEGPYVISSGQLGQTVFLSEEEALKRAGVLRSLNTL